MVKSGAERAAKFAMKYDAYVNMLRAKHYSAKAILNFTKIAYQQEQIDSLCGLDNLTWGLKRAAKDICIKSAWAENYHSELFYICNIKISRLVASLSIDPKETLPIFSDNIFNDPFQKIAALNSKVCAHNIISELAILLSNPSILYQSSGVAPLIHSSVIWALLPNVNAILSVSIANPNLYNKNPTLNSSVVKTP